MEKRAFARIPFNAEARVYCGNKVCDGTVMNISEKGMFISTQDMLFPFESQLDVAIPFNGKVFSVPVSLRRMEMSPDSNDGIGVEFMGPSEEYYQFVNSLRDTL
ncbi:MAG: PilZ domain-containing protein [Nitrospirae bacterium]|nr:PilZ domain-containing protein [Nitrospirota bacterium]